MNVQIINPTTYQGWDEMLLTIDKNTFYHTADWAKVLCESYKYKPLYFVVTSDGKFASCIPVMEIKSFLTGKRGVSLPFSDHCLPIAKNEDSFNEILEEVIKYGKKASWKTIEFRGGKESSHNKIPSETFLTHILDISQSEQKIFSTFRNSTKRNIKKAVKVGVQVKILNSKESIKEFYRLNCITRKNNGLPPQPFYFFRKLYEHIISTNKGLVASAFYRNKVVAIAVFFHFGPHGIYKYGASDHKYLNLRPNNLVMWEAIRWYIRNGYKTLCLGRTEPRNKGLLQFKRGWGTIEETFHYYKYDFIRNCFVNKKSGLKSSYNTFKHMPSFLLRLTGNLLYRHIG